MFEISTVTGDDIIEIHKKYQIPDDFLPLALRLEDRMISYLASCLAVYDKDLRAGLRFPLHPLIQDILQRYDIVLAQLGLNSFRVITAFVIFYHLAHVWPRLGLFRPFFTLNKLPGSKG